MKQFLVITALVVVALASDRPYYPKPAYYPKPSYPAPAYPVAEGKSYDYAPMPYSFDWAVKDEPSYNDFGHKETSDGKVVTGTYFVVLPDGRRQIVSYTVDDYGYVADVKYDGEAKYPEYKSAYSAYPKPTYSAPANPKPSYPKPTYQTPTYAPPAYPKPSYPAYPTYRKPSYPTYPRPAYPSYSHPSYPFYPKPSYPFPSTTEVVTEATVVAVKEDEPVAEVTVTEAEPAAEAETSTDAV